MGLPLRREERHIKADWKIFGVWLLEVNIFDDGVAAVEDDVQSAVRMNLNAFDHLTDCVVVIFTTAVSETFDAFAYCFSVPSQPVPY